MKNVRVLLSFAGDSFFATLRLPRSYFTADGELDMRIVKNRLEGNCVVREATVVEEGQ